MPIIRRMLLTAILMHLAMMSPAAAQWAEIGDQRSTPEAIDCAGLRGYWNNVYNSYDADLSRTEMAIIRAAWDGPTAWDQMSRVELQLARDFYEQWGMRLRATNDSEIPDGLDAMHEAMTRNIELLAIKIDAYIRQDWDAFNTAAQETVAVWEAMYVLAVDGVAQCGNHWIRVFGEPWDPTPEATPLASPAA